MRDVSISPASGFLMMMLLGACQSNAKSTSDASDDLGDAALTPVEILGKADDDLVYVKTGPFIPDTSREHNECTVNGISLPSGTVFGEGPPHLRLSENVLCQCAFGYGPRCWKDPESETDVCVFSDGQVLDDGETTVVDECFECTCTDGQGACKRKTGDACPSDGCRTEHLYFGSGDNNTPKSIPFGQDLLTSECHLCACDAELGLICENVCHPSCYCSPNQYEWCQSLGEKYPELVQGEFLNIPDQHRVLHECKNYLCDYSSIESLSDGCEQP